MREWMDASLSKLSKKSDTSTAIRYALGLSHALVRFWDDGSTIASIYATFTQRIENTLTSLCPSMLDAVPLTVTL